MQRFATTLSAVVLAVLWSPLPAPAATITVDSTADDFAQPANGNCTLREAVLAANTNAPVDGCVAGGAGPATVDVVAVPAGTYALTLGPRGDDAAQNGDLDLTDDVEIVGAGADLSRVDAGGIDRIFDVLSGVNAVISGLAIEGGDAGSGNGGGIQNGGDLTVEDSVVRGNSAGGPGGGIRNDRQVTVRRSLLAGNLTADHGGGMDNHGNAVIENSTVSGNDGGGLGGGLYNLGGVSMVLVHVTVHGNTASAGDAIHNAGTLSAGNNLLSGSCSGVVNTSDGGNLESPGNTCGLGPSDLVSVADPRLGPLAANGGTTETHALLAGSPAVDAGLAGPCLATDQRRNPRPVDGDGDTLADCDAGAFEATGMASTIFSDGFESGDFSLWQ